MEPAALHSERPQRTRKVTSRLTLDHGSASRWCEEEPVWIDAEDPVAVSYQHGHSATASDEVSTAGGGKRAKLIPKEESESESEEEESEEEVSEEEARQAQAQRAERHRRLQLEMLEQLAKERAMMAPEANPLCAPTPS